MTEDVTMRALPKGESARKNWVQLILKGRKDLRSEKDITTIVLFVRIISLMDNQQKVILHPVYF